MAPSQKQNGNIYSWTGDLATGYGLLTSVTLFDTRFDFETGAIYLNQSSERDSSGTTVTQNTHVLHLPLLFRFNFDERVGVGIGAYGSFAQGSIPTGTHDRDYGMLLSARASINIVPSLYFIVDGRYQHGFTNLANTPPGIVGDYLNTRSMQAYLRLF